MNCTFIHKNQLLLLKIAGRLSGSSSETFKDEVITQLSGSGCRNLLCDLGRLEYIDSCGIGALLEIQQQLSGQGGKMKLAEILPKPRLVFDRTKVYKEFEIFDSLESAMDTFNQEKE